MQEQKQIKTIKIPVHTIVLLVAPSNAGKSFLCKNVIIPQLKEQTKDFPIEGMFNIQYLSTDETRRDLLGHNFHKYDEFMMHVNVQAFDLLYNKLTNLTTYPVNAGVIILDSTGLSKEFRDKIVQIAKQNNYNVGCLILDYKNQDDYYKYVNNESSTKEGFVSKSLISKHVKRLKTEALREINRNDFNFIERIKNNDFDLLKFEVKDYEEYKSHFLSGDSANFIHCGDIHGCIMEFKELLVKHGFVIDENNILSHENKNLKVTCSDYIDKGYGIKEVVEFIHKNKDKFILVIGNHENYVYKHLKGLIAKDNLPKEFIDEQFSSIKIFEQDEDLKGKFFELFEMSKDFYIHKNFILTHAPCEKKYLGKTKHIYLKHQRTFRYSKRKDFGSVEEYVKAVETELDFFKKESDRNLPAHITGHIAQKNIMTLGNKINIDTGCVYGNKLSSVIINQGRKPFFLSVSSSENPKIENKSESLLDFFKFSKNSDIDFSQLESNERGRIFWSATNKINFISGTVSPSAKDEGTNDLESLSKGLDYFKEHNIKKVMLQRKYMGSRANLYLDKDISKCYTTSRNGYVVKQDRVDMTKSYQQLLDRPQIKKMFDEENVKMIVLDAEMLPWSALGKGLIERDFLTVDKAVDSEIVFLQENGFDEQLSKISQEYEDSGYDKLSNTTSKEDMKKQFTEIKERTFRAFKDYSKEHIPTDELRKLLCTYQRQMQLFGQEGEVNVKPFSILKIVYNDDSEKLFFDARNEDVYNLINDDDYVMIDFSDKNYYEKAEQFFKKVTESEEMEGIVIKPDIIYNYGVAPYMKVRSKRYLTIVFGMDFLRPKKYQKLLTRKSIKRKLETSIKEFAIGKKLLEIPYNTINDTNKTYLNLIAQMILEERVEKTLDPRL